MSCKCNNWTIITMITDHLIILTPQEKDNLLITVNLSLESELPEGKPACALIVYALPNPGLHTVTISLSFSEAPTNPFYPLFVVSLIPLEWPPIDLLWVASVSLSGWENLNTRLRLILAFPPSIFVYTGFSRSCKDDCLWRPQLGHIPWDSLKFLLLVIRGR